MKNKIIIENYLKNIQNEIAPLVPIAIAVSAMNLIMVSMRLYRDFLSKAARHCASLEGSERSMCKLKFEVEATKKLLSDLNSKKSLCNKNTDPDKKEKCVQQIDNKIEIFEDKLKVYMDQMDTIKQMRVIEIRKGKP